MARQLLMRGKAAGFTLLELVMVMVLLGVMATFSSGFISSAMQLYRDASSREQQASDLRFLLARLEIELRDALPGSLRVESDAQQSCIRFWPIATAGFYLAYNQALPGGRLGLAFASVPASAPLSGDYLVVYPQAHSSGDDLLTRCALGRCVVVVKQVVPASQGSPWQIEYDGSTPLASTLASEGRAYFASQQVRYCLRAGQMWRTQGSLASPLTSPEVLMADGIVSGRFYQDDSAVRQDNSVGVQLTTERNDERLTLAHSMEIWNVP